jgi:hypothetical protein
VATGTVACARCGELIAPGDRWDLGHDDENPALYAGPEHRACNRSTAARNGYGRPPRWTRETYPKDDPEAGIYWGPPSDLDPDATPRRWSRAWDPNWRDNYDWEKGAA